MKYEVNYVMNEGARSCRARIHANHPKEPSEELSDESDESTRDRGRVDGQGHRGKDHRAGRRRMYPNHSDGKPTRPGPRGTCCAASASVAPDRGPPGRGWDSPMVARVLETTCRARRRRRAGQGTSHERHHGGTGSAHRTERILWPSPGPRQTGRNRTDQPPCAGGACRGGSSGIMPYSTRSPCASGWRGVRPAHASWLADGADTRAVESACDLRDRAAGLALTGRSWRGCRTSTRRPIRGWRASCWVRRPLSIAGSRA